MHELLASLTSSIRPTGVDFLVVALVGGFLGAVIATALVIPRERRRLDADFRKRQESFVSLASHYLLSPISIIQTAASRLEAAEQGGIEARKKLYDAILRGEQRLWLIAEQLILVAQLDKNELTLRVEPADLNDTVTSAIAAVDAFAREKKIQIEFKDLALNTPTQVRFDQRRMKQALVALLDNAVKFSPEGSEVKVQMSIVSGVCQIVIEDAGIGMSQEIVDDLGRKFFRGTGIYDFDYEGMGLGLFIAQTIIHFHQGVLRVDSELKRGTRVVVEFPKE